MKLFRLSSLYLATSAIFSILSASTHSPVFAQNARGEAATTAKPLYELANSNAPTLQGGNERVALKKSSLASLPSRTKGEQVRLPLAGGKSLQGTIGVVLHKSGGTQVGGALANGQGSFVLENGAKQIEGNIRLTKTGVAYQFTVGASGTPTLVKKKLSDIICYPLPRKRNQAPRGPRSSRSLQSIPILNSRPDAVAQIYLDFDGETVTDPYWNDGYTIVAPAYDLTSEEITQIFNRVKEDYWPFNINITTSREKYNNAPASQRVQCIVTPNDAAGPGAGGIAFLGYFGTEHPCWVFNSDVIGISEAASHEVGHTMGLSHDGQTGLEYYEGHSSPDGGWAPIMGASYYQKVTQWSKGEYSNASNTQDDLAIISSSTNGFGYAPDEAGNTRATATPVTYASAGNAKIVGLINITGDTDYYAFTTSGGVVSLNAVGAQPSPNLNIQLQIEDATGKVLATANPADRLDASISATLAAGTYYLKIQGVGSPAPPSTGYTNYGSIGAYMVTGSIPSGTQRSAQAVLLAPLDNAAVTGSYNLRAKTTGNAQVKSLQFAYRPAAATLSHSPRTAIPDYSTITDTINYTGSNPLQSVTVNITHPYIGDLVVALIAPDGTRSVLQDRVGSDSDNIHQTYDVASMFAGKTTSGQWKIKVSDESEGDEGTLDSWSLNFAPTQWTEIATDSNGVNSSGEWTATWDTSRLLTGKYEVRALPIVSAADVATADVNSGVNVAGYSLPSVSVSDVSVTEGNSSTKAATFTISLSSAALQNVTVSYHTADLAASTSVPAVATAGTDYLAVPVNSVTFTPGQTSKTVAVSIKGDTLDEDDENFSLVVDNATNGVLVKGVGIGTIQDDDAAPTLSVSAASMTEGNSGEQRGLTFTVKLSAASARTITAQYQTKAATTAPATAGTDYTPFTLQTLTFNPGATSQQITVPILGDDLDEEDEHLVLALSNVVNATAGTLSAEGTIKDDDATPTLSSSDAVYVAEGSNTNTVVSFNVTLSAASGRTVTVKYATLAKAGQATAGVDFIAIPATTLTFAPGETSKVVKATIKYDRLDENDESFGMVLSAPVNATIAANTAQCIIQDDDAAPSLKLTGSSVIEGNGGTVVLPFTLKLSAASGLPVKVKYSTSDDTALGKVDYLPVTGVLVTFAPGEVSKTVNVTLKPDTLDEGNEKFNLNLSESVNVALLNSTVAGTILDDDTAPSITVSDMSLTEGNTSSKIARFAVKLSAASGLPVTVKYQTKAGTVAPATSDVDYANQALTSLTFEPGQTLKYLDVPVYGDTLDEADETFQLLLSSPVNVTIADGVGLGTIVDDDYAPKLSIQDASTYEGNSGTVTLQFAVTLSAPSGLPITVKYQSADKTAIAGSDYIGRALTSLTFLPGETSKTVSFTVKPDLSNENDETMAVTLGEPTNASLARATAIGQILNDDAEPSISATVANVKENATGAVLAFNLSLSAASGKPVSVQVQTLDDSNSTATGGVDYTVLPLTTVTFAPSEIRKVVNVAINDDALDELDETVTLQLSGPVNATLNTSLVTGTILDDDAAPKVSIDSVSVTEGNSGQQGEAIFTIRLSAPSSQQITASYETLNGQPSSDGLTNPAESGMDFGYVYSSVTFAPGETVKTISIFIYGDDTFELDETFLVQLFSPSNASISFTAGVGIGTIVNDDSQNGGGSPIKAPSGHDS